MNAPIPSNASDAPQADCRPFHTILVANRGEIAVRIMRTARRMGFRTVAVYSDADAHSTHVQHADVAVHIGASAVRESYLNIPAILHAAAISAADAIHPGYGFLAENADFAQAVQDAGLVFIGPSAQAIDLMGNKAQAKRVALEADMPCIPGYQGHDQSDEQLRTQAQRIGFPIMVKAAAGGGGRGMRLVHHLEDLPVALSSARSEALSAFGSAELILERALLQPRHVEIQLLADSHGHIIHLGERDCSVQRRHQKVIEEAPCPVLSPEVRQRMGEAAKRLAQTIGYVGAGTMEFLLDSQGQFYFMEMNTRLQVEHAVTEAITGLDLVEWQLRIASGQALNLQQHEVPFSGHAIEVRLTAEDVPAGFLPQTGTVLKWRNPQDAHWPVRVDHALYTGAHISAYYDSMIAKLVAHGNTREDTVRQLKHALQQCVVLGVTTNQGFLLDCLDDAVFMQGQQVHTGFVQERLGTTPQGASPQDSTVALAAWAALFGASSAPPHTPQRHNVLQPPPLHALSTSWNVKLAWNQQRWNCELKVQNSGWSVGLQRLDLPQAPTTEVSVHPLQWLDTHETPPAPDSPALPGVSRRLSVKCQGLTESVEFCWHAPHVHVFHAHRAWQFERWENRKNASAVTHGTVQAPLSARVVNVSVAVGDSVQAGQKLLVLEAMKMEHSLQAPLAGTIKSVHVQLHQQTSKGAVLVEIDPLPPTQGDAT